MRGTIKSIHSTCCQIILSLLERCPLARVSFKRGTTVNINHRKHGGFVSKTQTLIPVNVNEFTVYHCILNVTVLFVQVLFHLILGLKYPVSGPCLSCHSTEPSSCIEAETKHMQKALSLLFILRCMHLPCLPLPLAKSHL